MKLRTIFFALVGFCSALTFLWVVALFWLIWVPADGWFQVNLFETEMALTFLLIAAWGAVGIWSTEKPWEKP